MATTSGCCEGKIRCVKGILWNKYSVTISYCSHVETRWRAGCCRSEKMEWSHILGPTAGWVLSNLYSVQLRGPFHVDLIKADVGWWALSKEKKKGKRNNADKKKEYPLPRWPMRSLGQGPMLGHYYFTATLFLPTCHVAGQVLWRPVQSLDFSLLSNRGCQAPLWACDLPVCPVTTCQSPTVSLLINNSDTLIHQFHLRFSWQAFQLLNHRGWLMARHKHWWTLPSWLGSVSASSCQRKLQPSPQARFTIFCLPPKEKGDMFMHACTHPSIHPSIHPFNKCV